MIRNLTMIHRDTFNLLFYRIEWCNQLIHAFLPFQEISQRTHTHSNVKIISTHCADKTILVAAIFDVFITNACFDFVECVFNTVKYEIFAVSQSDPLLKICSEKCLEICCKMSWKCLAMKRHLRLCLQNVCNGCKMSGTLLHDSSLNSWKRNV